MDAWSPAATRCFEGLSVDKGIIVCTAALSPKPRLDGVSERWRLESLAGTNQRPKV